MRCVPLIRLKATRRRAIIPRPPGKPRRTLRRGLCGHDTEGLLPWWPLHVASCWAGNAQRSFIIDTDSDGRPTGSEKNAADRPDGWLGELTLPPERKADESRADSSRTGRRASDLGILPVSLEDYTRLLTWIAKQLRGGQRDTIPADLATVLDHFDVQQDSWLDTVDKYETAFGHAVGRPDSLVAVAERMELQYLKGISACRAPSPNRDVLSTLSR